MAARQGMQMPNTPDDDSRPLAYLRNIGIALKKGRLLAYSSEVGESGRPVMNRWIVRGLYGVSFCYVALDLGHHYASSRHDIGDRRTRVMNYQVSETAVMTTDRAVWHSLASFALPTICIHSIVKYSTIGLTKFGMRYPTRIAPLVGLSFIPFIIHPIDAATDWFMDNTARRFYDHKQN